MTRPAAFLLVVAVPAILSLAGCASRPLRGEGPAFTPSDAEAYAALSAREADLAGRSAWTLRGRVAFAHGEDGATAQLEWTQRGDAFDIRLVAPITGRSWALRGRPGEAVLSGLEGGERRADDAEALLREATGWTLPVSHFPAWVRGVRGPGAARGVAVDEAGRPLGFSQAGWSIRFPDWEPGDPPLPRRIFAERDGASVRVVVSAWGALPVEVSP